MNRPQAILNPELAAECGKVLVLDDSRELLATALKALGASANAAEPGAFGQAAQLLASQGPCVARYGTTGVDADGLRLAAHALKSSSGNVGATGLAGIASQLEALGRDQQLDAARPPVTQMAEEQQRVVDALLAERAAA